MKKLLVIFMLLFSMQMQAQGVAEVIRQGVIKAIKAVDLKIQRLQNKTIWLQNAQKSLENTMSDLKLKEISDWVEKQRKLYDDYFQELWKVKLAISYYQRVKDIIKRQGYMVKEYKDAWTLFRQDGNFTSEELDYMYTIYSGMFAESRKYIDQLFLVINSFSTRMSDAKRLEIINNISDNLEQILMDLKQFNSQNKLISLQRASEKGEIELIRKLYGL